MSKLRGFLAENAIKVENQKFVVSDRFLDEEGKPLEWEVRCLNFVDEEEILKECYLEERVKGGGFDIDQSLYYGKLAVKATVFPNLNDAKLQNSYGVMGSEMLLKTMLTSSEYTEYLGFIRSVGSKKKGFKDKVAEVKN